MRGSDLIRAIVLVGMLCGIPATSQADAPQRVVSMNLCTDQLAMMLAAPGQLVSVTYLAQDARASAMATQAQAYPANRGLAEDVYLLQPDLVIAGSFTTRATVAMLERLGLRVEVFPPVQNLQDIGPQILRMGDILGQPARAATIADQFTTDLAAFQAEMSRNPRAALYAANGYTSGPDSLSGQILATAGFANIATEAGYDRGGLLPLEVLVMQAPEAVITSRPYPGNTRAEAVLQHPALHAAQNRHAMGRFSDRDWVCGTPYVLRAVADMADLRRSLTQDSLTQGSLTQDSLTLGPD